MAEHPLLCFPYPEVAERQRSGGGGPSHLRLPDARRQGARLNPVFQGLVDAVAARNMELRDSMVGVLPDQVLVLETVGTVEDFAQAVSKIHGLEWLVERELLDIPSDDDFHDDRDERALSGRLFLVMTDAGALDTLRLRFNDFQKDPGARFPIGLAPLKRVFEQLRTIRLWGPEDRMAELGLLDNWRFRLEYSSDTDLLPFEAELWFRNTTTSHHEAEARFRATVESLGGVISRSSVIPEISYHGVLGRIPRQQAARLVDHRDSRLALCEDVMFLRPLGQCTVPRTDGLAYAEHTGLANADMVELDEPVAALLDGLPLVGHNLLNGRLMLDDPDGYESYYQARQRHHGTAMASLICHGELDDTIGKPLTRRLYVRPILRPVADGPDEYRPERISDDELPVDLIHRAVRRLFDGDGDEAAVAPGVRVINLSVCDDRRPFVRDMSPWARLLDWLSVKYEVLFIVSAGNHAHSVNLEVSRDDFRKLDPAGREAAVFKALAADTRNRSLLSPAETLNGLTVGSAHADFSEVPEVHRLVNPFERHGFPNVVSAHGPGYRGAVKPDLILPGGRQMLREKIDINGGNAILDTIGDSARPPGQQVAYPGEQGSLDAIRYVRGTSNATALATRAACQIYDVLNDLRSQSESFPSSEFDVVLLKTLLVHGANCQFPLGHYAAILDEENGTSANKSLATRLIGYGFVNLDRVMFCNDHRVTALGWGEIGRDEAHVFRFPAPQGLSGVASKRRMISTLAWLSPINCSHRNYRRAYLEAKLDRSLAETSIGVTYPNFNRGTVRHDVREGKGTKVINENEMIDIRVECRADAGTLEGRVKYGLAVTLEVSENLNVLIYEEIRDKLAIRDQVQVRT